LEEENLREEKIDGKTREVGKEGGGGDLWKEKGGGEF
jgi:hypothetical protein